MPDIAYEDIQPGSVTRFAPIRLDRESMLAFAREYDPQPMHVDEEAARHSFVGELIGSGWYTCATVMRAIADNWLLRSTSMGSPGVDEVRWLRPVKPGDTLHVTQTVLDKRVSASKPDRGFVNLRFDVTNGDGKAVMQQTNPIMFGLRHPNGQPDDPGSRPARPAAGPEAPVGETEELGSHLFTAEEIKRFAAAYDPQAFHLDEAAAAASQFGALCASGWHTGAVWMKLMVRNRTEAAKEAARTGTPFARLGPSPGFTKLKWLKPVYAGDTISYRSRITSTRPSASRPGWELMFHYSEGADQTGKVVFSFQGCVLRQVI